MTIQEMLDKLETLKTQVGGDIEVAMCVGKSIGYVSDVREVRLTNNDHDIEDGVPAIIGYI